MPRPIKYRKVCHFPKTLGFYPDCDTDTDTMIILTVDEYEVIRLIDKEGMTQKECSEFMQIARTTVQRIYENARKKLAWALVDGLELRIEGGDFCLCDGRDFNCGHDKCFKQLYHQKYKKPKGDYMMRIAVTYENGQISQHFGHTEQFKIYDIADGKITSSKVVDTEGSGHGALAGILSALEVDALICGGIGGGAQMALAAANIKLYGGVAGDADTAVAALLNGQLDFNPDVHCDHHDHEHGEGHTCGDHGCGSHSCGNH